MEKKIDSYAVIRVIGCISIIVLHSVFSSLLMFQNNISSGRGMISNIIANSLMWGVPCFLMVSGALLLEPSKKISLQKIYTKYIARMLKALIFCSLLFAVIDLFMNHESLTISFVVQTLKKLLTGTGWSHLWYLYLMIGIYMLLPFYKKLTEYCTALELKYLSAILLIFLSIIPFVEKCGISMNIYFPILMIYPFYFLLGYILKNDIISISRKTSICLLVCSSLLIIFLTYLRWNNGWDVLEYWWTYASPIVLVQSVSIFQLLCEIKTIPRKGLRIFIYHLDRYSFGIYLFHMIWIRVMLRVFNFNPYSTPIIGLLVLIFSSFIVGYVITGIVKVIGSIKYLKK